MKKMDYKYRNDLLSPQELQALRRQVNAMTDEEMEETMRRVWMEEEPDARGIDDARMERLKRQIDARTGAGEEKRHVVRPLTIGRILRVAAAVLLPVFVLATVYLYTQNAAKSAEQMVVSTGVREKANITLPDGTSVALNAESRLSYAPHIYNKEERKIHFEGEGYFQVQKNKECPFLIDGNGLEIKVLGTTFNLSVRQGEQTAELYLEEGSVQLASTLTGKRVTLEPKEKAILNQHDGDIVVVKEETADATAWRRSEMVFKDAPFAEVLRKIKESYGVQIETDYQADAADLFTGTITTADIFEALKIVEITYGLTAHIQGEKVILRRP